MVSKFIQKINKDYSHLYILSYYIVTFLAYTILNKITVPKYYMYSVVDNYIPFVKEMIIPYLYWYVYIGAAVVYLGLTNKRSFYNLIIFIFAGMTISFIIYVIFPNGQNLRPVIEGNDIFSNMVQGIYLTDNPTNSAPSMHVINTIAVHLALINDEKLSKIKWVKIGSLISAILIIASTVMVKQHSIVDVVGGMVVSSILYLFIYYWDNLYELLLSKFEMRKVQRDYSETR